MGYYRVLLVDDEAEVRSAIVRKLDWHSLGFEVVGEASNGQEALEMVQRLEPDVVMTDIKMPFMDGLELCRCIKRQMPGVRVTVFSGFDEFEYAKEAIAQQVEEYILKPIDAEELAAVFRRLRESLDREIAARRDVERLRRHYEESLPLMRQQLFSDLLSGRMDARRVAGRLQQYEVDMHAAAYCVAAVRYERGETADPDDGLLDVSLRQLMEDTLCSGGRVHIIPMFEHTAALFLLDDNEDAGRVGRRLAQLFPAGKKLLDVRLSIGVGGVGAHAGEVPQSYREACSALEYQLLVDPGQCIHIGDIEPGVNSAEVLDHRYTDELLRLIKVGDEGALRDAVGAMIHYLKGKQAGMQQYHIYLLELFTELLGLIRTYRMDPAEAKQDELLLEGTAFRMATLDEFGVWLLGYCDNLRVLARRERKHTVISMVEQAKAMLQEGFADSELSLDKVCARLGASPAYFSTVFKKETGQGFVEFLTGLRMQKALELLTLTDDKTYQIADKVGYGDPNYFSYVFKKHYGAAPSKYKADRMTSHAAH